MNRRHLLAMITAAVITLGSWQQANAFRCILSNCVGWCESPVPYALQTASADMGEMITEREVERAMGAWAKVECTSLKTQYRGRSNEVPSRGNGVLAWLEESWPHGSGTIGTTTTTSNGRCVRSSIRFNGVHFKWVVGAPRQSREVNAFSIIAHEGGHYLGLGHSEAGGAIMAARYAGGELTITGDDQAGICRVYAGGGGGVAAPEAAPDAGAPAPSPAPSPSPMPTPEQTVQLCQEDDDCGADERCDDSGRCVMAAPDGDDDTARAPDGEACQMNSDCARGICLKRSDAEPYCTRPCGERDACADGFVCSNIGGISLCTMESARADEPAREAEDDADEPAREAEDDDDDGGGGCSAAGGRGPADGLPGWLLVIAALALPRLRPKPRLAARVRRPRT